MAKKDFHHPFEPYNIQQQFMEAVYNCIENGRVGIFESPTGTGKSLSLICGSLTWLREHKRNQFDQAIEAIQVDDDEPEWMVAHAREERRNRALQMRADFEARLEAVRKREQRVRDHQGDGERPLKKRKLDSASPPEGNIDEDQYVLADYDSEGDSGQLSDGRSGYSRKTTRLMGKLGMLPRQQDDRAEDEPQEELKIFFCSRTHSQLSQFVGELKRVKLPAGLPVDIDKFHPHESVRHLTLGSRKNLCINPEVSRLDGQTAINERCMELQQSSTSTNHKCPYLPSREDQALALDFRDLALANIRDIEDLASLGRQLQICPYYASRPAIGPAEIVTLPYPLLLQKSARDALGISLKGHVVIIDEAHNLINAVENIHSAQVTERQLRRSRECLMTYLHKFRNRLKGSNRVYVTQLVRVIDSLLLAMDNYKGVSISAGVAEPGALLSGRGVDQINLGKLIRYINDSRLARKVEGYVAHLEAYGHANIDNAKSKSGAETPSLTQIQSFLSILMHPSKEGQLFWAREGNGVTFRYLLLDPSEHFRGIIEDARAVILAGGTMSPMEEYQEQLFPYVTSVETLSCGHLVPRENLLVRIMRADRQGSLEFDFKSRGDAAIVARLGSVLQRIARIVKGGLVVFFSSYVSLKDTLKEWKRASVFTELGKIKPIHCDERYRPAEETFASYRESIKSSQNGAILLSVLGGKLSEGINFSDDLGRCVVVVGLPYPNLDTPEWKAKMSYIEDRAAGQGSPKSQASREYAENICMRSVNQAIGRVIRHKDDWASIVLLDQRYSRTSIRSKLPGWIRESMQGASKSSSQADSCMTDLGSFFQRESS